MLKKNKKQLDSLLVGLNEPSFSDLVISDDGGLLGQLPQSMSLSSVSTQRAAKRRRRTALEELSTVQMLAPSQTGNQGRDQRRFVLFPRQALGEQWGGSWSRQRERRGDGTGSMAAVSFNVSCPQPQLLSK